MIVRKFKEYRKQWLQVYFSDYLIWRLIRVVKVKKRDSWVEAKASYDEMRRRSTFARTHARTGVNEGKEEIELHAFVRAASTSRIVVVVVKSSLFLSLSGALFR